MSATWAHPFRYAWFAGFWVVFWFPVPASLTRPPSVRGDRADPLNAVVGYHVAFCVSVTGVRWLLPLFALFRGCDRTRSTCALVKFVYLLLKRLSRLPSPELGLRGLNQVVQFFVCHVSEIHFRAPLVEGVAD